MSENQKIIAKGNEAVCWGAVSADCHYFFGYPVTPQNEITEWFAAEYPKQGWSFVQGESEWAVTGMLFGASAAGARVITSTAGPGWGLMQEILSSIAAANLPVVIVVVQRGGPGQGTTSHAQMDYSVSTRGGHGGWHNIVLGPSSVQENCDMVQWGFHLADKYRIPVVVLTDAIVGQMVEKLEIKKLEFGPLPAKNWAMAGHGVKGPKFDMIASAPGMIGSYVDSLRAMQTNWDTIAREEVRWEDYKTEDADLVLVAYGYPSRACMEAVDIARAEGLKVGLLRPITLWPFPYAAVKKHTDRGAKLMVVEDSLGQLVDDVRIAVGPDKPVSQVTALDRHNPTYSGMIMPDVVLNKIRQTL